MSDPLGDLADVLADRLLDPALRAAVAGALDGLSGDITVVQGDVRAGAVDRHHERGGARYAVLDDGNEVGQVGNPDQRPHGRDPQVLVEQDLPVGSRGDKSTPAAPHRGMGCPHAGFDAFDHARVDRMVFEVLADVTQSRVELGAGVGGVVRVVEVDRDERSLCVDQSTETICVHCCPLVR